MSSRTAQAARWGGALLLLALSWAIFFHRLGARSLLGDESAHAEAAREAAISGHWWPLEAFGGVYVEKPPLTIWATAAVFRVFGVSERNDRILDALLGVATVLLVYACGCAMFGARAALAAGLLLLSTHYFIFLHGVRDGVPDAAVVFLVSGALLLYFLTRQKDRAPAGFWPTIACGFQTGLVILSKNAVGWFVVLILGAFEAIRAFPKRPSAPSLKRIAVIGLFALAFQAAWFFAVSRATGGGAGHFFYRDVWERFTVGLDPGHRIPGLYRFILKVDFGKGLLVLPAAVFFAFRDHRFGNRERAEAVLFLFIWAAAILLVMESSISKLPWYIYPAYPAIVLLLGFAIDRVAAAIGRRSRAVSAAFLAFVVFFIGMHVRRAWNTAERDVKQTGVARLAEWLSAPGRPALCREPGLHMREWEEYYLRPLAREPQRRAFACGLLLTRNPAAYLTPQEIPLQSHKFHAYSPLDLPLYVVDTRRDLPAALFGPAARP
ncbi:MAG: ArnT family glycosyltransferase [Thermoanaerobaculia bacterium]